MDYLAAIQRPQNYYRPIEQGTVFLAQRITQTTDSGEGSPWETEGAKFFFAGGSSRPLQFYNGLYDTHIEVLKGINIASLSEAEILDLLWEGIGGFLPWWKRRWYNRGQQRVPLVNHEIHLPKPRALAGVPTMPKQRALVDAKTGPAAPGAKGAGAAGAKVMAAIKALTRAAAFMLAPIVKPQERFVLINGSLISKDKRKKWQDQADPH